MHFTAFFKQKMSKDSVIVLKKIMTFFLYHFVCTCQPSETSTGLGYGSDSDEDEDREGGRNQDEDSNSDSDEDIADRIRRKKEAFDRAQRHRLDEIEQEEADLMKKKKRMQFHLGFFFLFFFS